MQAFMQTIDSICSPLPGAEFEADNAIPSWKVGGKMFACVAHKMEGVSVKCPDVETAAMLIDTGIGEKAPYFHRSWIRMGPSSDTGELSHRIHVSYDIVRKGLPKKLQAQWPQREE